MPTKDATVTLTLKCDEHQREAYDIAAEEAGMSRQAWAKAILDAASGYSRLPEHLRRVTRRRVET